MFARPVSRLARYVLGVLAVFAALEAAFRIWEPEVAACGHRVATKALLLDKQGPMEALFFGTSRTWDAVSPRLFSEESAALQPGIAARGFNLAVTSSNLDTLEQMARRFAGRPGLRLALLELSQPQLDPGEPEGPPRDALEELFARRLRLIAHRTALRGESLERLPELLFFPRRMDGSEVRFADQLAAALGRQEPRAPPVDLAPLAPAPVAPAPIAPDASVADPRAARLDAVARLLRERGAAVVFVVPPVHESDRTAAVRAVAASLARDWPVWDFGAAPFPEQMFRDGSHLNRAGRALLSRLLAVETARAGLLGPGLARGR
jgi:hypothetical protein